MKLTTLEKRAKAACEQYDKYGGGVFEVHWNKSREWGMCPRISWRGDKAAYAGGYGYDKLSTVLAVYLAFLPGVDLANSAGAGLPAVEDALLKAGWILEHYYDGTAEDGFRLSRVRP